MERYEGMYYSMTSGWLLGNIYCSLFRSKSIDHTIITIGKLTISISQPLFKSWLHREINFKWGREVIL